MSWKVVILVVVILVSAAGIGMAGTAGADDGWGDSSCWSGSDDGPIVSSGEHSGTILSPDDQDNFRVQLEHGEYLSISAAADDNIDISTHGVGAITVQEASDVNVVDDGSPGGLRTVRFDRDMNSKGTWELWADEDTVICTSIEATDDEPDVPFEWTIAFEKNDPDPPEFNPGDESLEEEIDELEEENAALESEVDELEASLEDEIDELEEENAALESEVGELEAELESADDTDVIFDISVEPEDAVEFQHGGEANIDIDVENADPGDVEITFAGNQYTAADGQAIIPLDSVGTHELSFSYEDTEETVLLNVADDDSDDSTDDTDPADDDTATADDGTDDTAPADDDQATTDDDVPGFGVTAALMSLLAIISLLVRRNKTN